MVEPGRPERVRLLLVDDLVLLRESVSRLLAGEDDLEVAGECGSTAEALDLLSHTPIDVAVIDHRLLNDRSIHLMTSTRHSGRRCKVLVIADPRDLEESLGALQLGASGIFPKNSSPDLLATAIRVVAGGNAWLDQRLVGMLAERVSKGSGGRFPTPISQRERQVLDGVCAGLTNREMAERLNVSEGTVKSTLRQLFRRVRVQKRSQLVRIALGG